MLVPQLPLDHSQPLRDVTGPDTAAAADFDHFSYGFFTAPLVKRIEMMEVDMWSVLLQRVITLLSSCPHVSRLHL